MNLTPEMIIGFNVAACVAAVFIGVVAIMSHRNAMRVSKVARNRIERIRNVEHRNRQLTQMEFDAHSKLICERQGTADLNRRLENQAESYNQIQESYDFAQISIETLERKLGKLGEDYARIKRLREVDLKILAESKERNDRLRNALREHHNDSEEVQRLNKLLESERKDYERLKDSYNKLVSRHAALWKVRDTQKEAEDQLAKARKDLDVSEEMLAESLDEVDSLKESLESERKYREKIERTIKELHGLADCNRQLKSYEFKGDKVYHHGELIGTLKTIHQYGKASGLDKVREKHIDIIVTL